MSKEMTYKICIRKWLTLKHAILVVLGWKAMMAAPKKEKREQTPTPNAVSYSMK
jgi:hypothetical protein